MTLPRPVSTGTLAKTPLAHLFVYALDKALTGTFELACTSGETATILVIEGKVAKIRTSKAVAYLGPLLYEMGVIDDEQLNASLVDVARTRQLHGRVLLDRGWITQEMLAAALREQTLRKLAHLFALSPETMFSFHPETDMLSEYGGEVDALIDPFPAIWRGIREYPSEAHVANVIKRIGSAACRLGSAAELARFDLQGDEQTAADALRLCPMTVSQLAAAEDFGARRAELLLYCFLITKQIELVNPVRDTTRFEAVEAPQNPISQKMRTARDRPISFVLQAAAPMSSRPPRRSSAPPASRDDNQWAARRQAIRQRAQTIQNEDLFQRLGLPRGESLAVDQIEDAFATLRMQWDPAALPVQLEDVRDDCWIVLSAMADAHARLIDAERSMEEAVTVGASDARDAMLEELAGTGTTNLLDGAKVCLARHDVERAERLARRALKVETQPGRSARCAAAPLALVAWVESMKPEFQTSAATRIRIAMLDKAIEIDDSLADAFYWRGQLYKRSGDDVAAVRDFKRAVAIDDKHMDAVRELRVHEMRARNARDGGLSAAATSRPPARSGGKRA